MKTTMMKAAVATAYGNYEVLEIQNVALPQLGDNEILIKNIASTVTRADTMMLTGKPYFARLFLGFRKPKNPILGTGFAGIVSAIGKHVTNFEVGDQVFGETAVSFSANAEYLSISENAVVLHKPKNLPYAAAATFTDGFLTSYNFLKRKGEIKKGQKVLVNGAAGALGTAAVQIAKYFGAEVTGVCSTKNLGLIKSLGADHVIDYKKEDFTKSDKKYDLIYDSVGKSSFSKSKAVLKKFGRFLSPVLSFPLLMQMLWTSIFGSKKAIFEATGVQKEAILRELLTEVLEIQQNGHLDVVIDRQYPLEKTAEAHKYVAAGHKKGNVVVNIWD